MAWLASRNPPRQTNPNTAEYFSEDVFPLIADSELGVWNRPNHHFMKETRLPNGTTLTTEVWFDRFGARVPGPGLETPDRVDIVIVGESNTWGQGMPCDDTYAAVLGKRLGLSVANFGLIASSGVQDLLIVRRFISKRPRFIVYGLWEEHFSSNIRRCPNIDSPVCLSRPFVREDRRGRHSITLPVGAVRNLREYLRWYRETIHGGQHSLWRDMVWKSRVLIRAAFEKHLEPARRRSVPWPVLASGPNWPRVMGATNFVISEMKQLADSVKATLVIVYLPFYFSDTISPAPRELVAHCANIGATFVSMDALWSQCKAQGTEFVIPAEGHLNARGHRDIAEALGKAIGRCAATQDHVAQPDEAGD